MNGSSFADIYRYNSKSIRGYLGTVLRPIFVDLIGEPASVCDLVAAKWNYDVAQLLYRLYFAICYDLRVIVHSVFKNYQF